MAKPLVDSTWKGVPHFRIRADVADSPAWRVLSFPAKALYVDLRAKLRSNNNGNISAALSEMKHRGWNSSATLAGALYQLLALGFILKTRGGGVERGSKVCSLYGFSDLEVNAFAREAIERRKATFEYRQYQTIAEAKNALRAGVAALREGALARKRECARGKNGASDSEAVKAPSASDSEAVSKSLLQKMKQTARSQIRLEAAPMLGFGHRGPLDMRSRSLLQIVNTLLN